MTAGFSILIMLASAIAGFFLGAAFDQPLDGAILGALIAGIGCIVAAINEQKLPPEQKKNKFKRIKRMK